LRQDADHNRFHRCFAFSRALSTSRKKSAKSCSALWNSQGKPGSAGCRCTWSNVCIRPENLNFLGQLAACALS